MKFIYLLIIVALGSYVFDLFLPWWSIVIAGFAGGMLFRIRGRSAFLAGVISLGLLWGGTAFIINIQNQSILSERIAALFNVGEPAILILLTGIIGGVIGGFATLSGNLFRKLFYKD